MYKEWMKDTNGESALIEIENLTMAYTELPVLKNVNACIKSGCMTALIGPNGAGKSTLLKGILNLMKPLTGSIRIMGRNYREVRKEIAYIPQTESVNWNFPTTVFDVVLMGRYTHLQPWKGYGKKDREIAKKAICRMEMEEFANRQISELSGGQRQRVFIARAIAQEAEIYLLDEPLAGVDTRTEKIIMDTLHDYCSKGKSVIAVHHDLSTVKTYFDYVLMINKQVMAQGRSEEVFTGENLRRVYGAIM